MAQPGANESLAEVAEAWLAHRGGWLAPRLPRSLLALQEAEQGRARFRGDIVLCVAGITTLSVFYPFIRASMSPVPPGFDFLYLGVLAPCLVLSLAMILARPRPLWRELALGLPSLIAMMVQTYLFRAGGSEGSVLFVPASLMLMLFAAVSVHLRFELAVAWMICAETLFIAGIVDARDITTNFRIDLTLIAFACGFYMLAANRRMHAEQQRSFVFALREQWRRDALAAENRTLDDLARRDALTGLANRRAYDSWLHNLWLQASGSARSVALIMLDVDHFKLYNDFYGHPAGDACLATVGACLREQLRGTSDQVARIGGEEFAVLLPGVGLVQCAEIAERLRLAIFAMELPHLGHGAGKILTISCGCASLGVTEGAPTDLCRAADAALYQAKESGRNRVCVGEISPHARADAVPGTKAQV